MPLLLSSLFPEMPVRTVRTGISGHEQPGEKRKREVQDAAWNSHCTDGRRDVVAGRKRGRKAAVGGRLEIAAQIRVGSGDAKRGWRSLDVCLRSCLRTLLGRLTKGRRKRTWEEESTSSPMIDGDVVSVPALRESGRTQQTDRRVRSAEQQSGQKRNSARHRCSEVEAEARSHVSAPHLVRDEPPERLVLDFKVLVVLPVLEPGFKTIR